VGVDNYTAQAVLVDNNETPLFWHWWNLFL